MVYTYSGILAIIQNKIMSFAATWMDLEIFILSQTEKEKYMIAPICRTQKNETNIYKTGIDSQTRKTSV